jgi:hypothetical protein
MAKSLSLFGWIAGCSILAVLGGPASATAQNKLEPTGPPAPTMKRLDEIPPTWSQILPAAERFQLVFDGYAVLDKETGLVWEQSPSSSNDFTWSHALLHCVRLQLGNRMGWRLPTIQELMSLRDPSLTPPSLPAGHPFNSAGAPFQSWSATTNAFSSPLAWHSVTTIVLGTGVSFTGPGASDKTTLLYAWCVRGGQVVDPQ